MIKIISTPENEKEYLEYIMNEAQANKGGRIPNIVALDITTRTAQIV